MSEDLLRRGQWRDPAGYDHWLRDAYRLSVELKRTTGRQDMPSFGRWLNQVSPGWPWRYAHLRAVRRALRRVERGQTTRLMIFLHPRSFKSQMVTVRYPAYLVERDPLTRIIIGSYNQSLAESFSREAQRIAVERGVAMNPKRQAAEEWVTAAGGGVKAAGVGAGVTGKGGNYLLIDDPVKSYEEARSAAYRERVWNWWTHDMVTRLEPHPRDGAPGAVILIMTRWHEDDLAGRILSGEGGDKWSVLRIPALAETQAERDDYNRSIGRPPGEPDPLGREPGAAMNPERFDEAALAAMAAEQGVMSFMSLYQQRPSAPQGDMFRREWFEVVAAVPDGERTAVRYWDKAGSTGVHSAYSAGVLMVRTGDPPASYVAHLVMGKWPAAERERVIMQTAAADFAQYGYHVETVVEQEPGSGGKESAEGTVGRLSAAGYRAAADRPTGDKTLRAEPLAAQASLGKVKLVAGEWNRDYLDILAAFPGGAIKDAVDASSGAYARLTRSADKRPRAGAPNVTRAEDIFGTP